VKTIKAATTALATAAARTEVQRLLLDFDALIAVNGIIGSLLALAGCCEKIDCVR